MTGLKCTMDLRYRNGGTIVMGTVEIPILICSSAYLMALGSRRARPSIDIHYT